MKYQKSGANHWFIVLAAVAIVTFGLRFTPVLAQGTAFTYQGRLQNSTNLVTGSFDLVFSLYNVGSGGSNVAGPVTNTAVGVTNGLFTTSVDFGAGAFAGGNEWLGISVRTNGSGAFSVLTPRQPLTPTPNAIYAETAGSNALISDIGTQNFFAGQSAGNLTLTGTHNTGVGYGALTANTGGDFNTANGDNALSSNTSGGNNTAEGVFALWKNSTGNGNTALGADALAYNTTGSNNAAIGVGAAENNTTGSYNVALGVDALVNNVADNGVVAIGFEALQNDAASGGFLTVGSANTAIGFESLRANGAGADNTALGYQTLYDNTSGYDNNAVGVWALLGNTTGYNNTANGYLAMFANTTGDNNTASGANALAENSIGNNNTADGAGALSGSTGATGGGNTASGSASIASLTTGYNNTAAGFQALYADTSGFDNVAIGVSTLLTNIAGYQNTGVGTYSFQALTGGHGNIALGCSAGGNLISGNNNIFIGNSGASSDNNVMRLGTVGTQDLTSIAGNSVGINMGNPTAALDVNGEFAVVEGLGGVRCYLGDDGNANDVQIGSLTSGVTAISCYNAKDNAYMHLYCSSITIEGGADLAEPFKIASAVGQVPPGAVVVIDKQNPGHLKLSDQDYDPRVAGVVSGANGVNPGIQLQQQGLLEGGQNVALTGRVYVQADTSNGSIEPGDLLTTSRLPGRAMKVTDHNRAAGAILGKALTALAEGQGMVLVLVTLQ